MTARRRLAFAGGGAVLAATLATPLLAGTAAASSQTLNLRMHSVSDTTVDNGQKGFSAGDDEVQTTRLTHAGKTVGWEAGNCVTTRVAKTADQLCQFVFHLNKGQIVAVGAVRAGQSGPGTFEIAIAGGTGAYTAARGHVSITATNRGSVPVEIDVRY